MVGADAAQLGLRGVGADPGEEDTHFGLPALQVGAQDRRLLAVGELRRPERLRAASDAQLSLSPDAEPGLGEERDGRLEDVVREPTWTNVSRFRLAAVHALVRYPRS